MNLPVDDAVRMVAMFAAKRKDRTVVVPLEPSWLLMVDLLDDGEL